MEILDKLKKGLQEVQDKATDAIVTAKSIFEKGCKDYVCYSLNDLNSYEEVKAKIIDREHIQFSGDIRLLTKELAAPKFFVDADNTILEINECEIIQKIEEIEQKARVGQHITTIAPFCYKKLALVPLNQ